jgi:hypothetical protein
MKKLFILALFIANFANAQSITVFPTTNNQTLELKKLGIGLNHRDVSSITEFGTSINNGEAFFQTHNNYPLYFSTNNGSTQMILSTNGSLGIGLVANPTHKLFVQGNAYISGNLVSDGQVSVSSLIIGGGSTINKFFKVYLPAAKTPGITAKSCSLYKYAVSGVSSTDIVTMSVVGSLPGNIVIANVIPVIDGVIVKYCNNGTTDESIQTVDVKFNIFK